MEMNQIQCDNLGMTRDLSVSKLSKGQDGITNYAFENHNIRIMAVNDNTKFSVTNEKSTKYEGTINGIFIGGCILNHYLTIFVKDPTVGKAKPDYIYRLYYNGTTVEIVELYNGNLNFQYDHPIEAIGYYESEEIQKVYWLDGLNQNRFINITAKLEYFYYISGDYNKYYYKPLKNIILTDGTLYAICKKNSTEVYYTSGLNNSNSAWTKAAINTYIAGGGTTIAGLPTATLTISTKVNQYNDYSFDFQGRINKIPTVGIEKNYNKAGVFQAGTIQYFFTYYNKFGVETCIVWNSDLQYLSLTDRGAKADEAVSCGFDFEISDVDTQYDYLRVYANYRSGIDGTVSTRIVADISLVDVAEDDTIHFTDLGNAGINFNSEDMFYLGGQKIIANTLDYKQDTLFMGDIINQNSTTNVLFPKYPIAIKKPEFNEDLQDANGTIVSIQEGQYRYASGGQSIIDPFIQWVYKYVSPIAKEGVYQYDPELINSQEEVAGFKWREVYRFGIQFMNHEGEWTSAFWLGDKYCDLSPRNFTSNDIIKRGAETVEFTIPTSGSQTYTIDLGDATLNMTIVLNATTHRATVTQNGVTTTTDITGMITFPVNIPEELFGSNIFGNTVRVEYYDANGNYVPVSLVKNMDNSGNYYWSPSVDTSLMTQKQVLLDYTKDGCYIASAEVNIQAIKNSMIGNTDIDFNNYIAYRLLVADTDITNRRIVEQGVINPTMFNYADRYNNRPFTIPSWLFRPRGSKLTHRHYDTLPVQTESTAELQGIVKKQIPGFASSSTPSFNSFTFIFAANAGSIWSGFEQWKLIYYDSGKTEMERAERLYLSLYTGVFPDDATAAAKDAEYDKVAELVMKYGVPLKTGETPGSGITTPVDAAAAKTLLQSGAFPVYVYGYNYRVISSRWEHYKSDKDKQGTLQSWGRLRSWLVDEITSDMKNTTPDRVGEDLAGHIILSPAMLPSEDQIKAIARAGSDAATIALAIAAALTAAAAVVVSALSFGSLAAPMAILASVAIGAATTALAGAAVGAAATAAVVDLQSQQMSDIVKEMLAMGYLPMGDASTKLSDRKQRSKYIGNYLDKFFHPAEYWENSGLAGFNSWNVPQLFREPETGKPFRTGHPYTKYGCIGEDWNAFAISGKLNDLNEEELDTKRKQNLFCIDESIVTLNAPDVEDISNLVNNSQALKLDIVGLIPVDATYGMYQMQTENGLTSSSQVIQNKFKTAEIGEGANSAIGMINGELYQDFKMDENNFDDLSGRKQVQETVGTYRSFMWHRDYAGFAFPNVSLTDGLGAEVNTFRSKIVRKLFANMRYSTNSEYHTPFNMKIESPVVCLDAQSMLKTFKYARLTKNYYENVDTISVNSDKYPLILDAQSYPGSAQRITNAGLQDPVRICYRETPHIVIPFEWNRANNGSVILPYLESEKELVPTTLYKDLGAVELYGIVKSAPQIGNTYYLIEAPDYATATTDTWNINNPNHRLTVTELIALTELLNPGHSIRTAITNINNQLLVSRTDAEILAGSYYDDTYTNKTIQVDTTTKPALEYAVEVGLLSKLAKVSGRFTTYGTSLSYLLHVTANDYYIISFNHQINDPTESSAVAGYTSVKVTSLPINTKIVVSAASGENGTVFSSYIGSVKDTLVPGETSKRWSIYPTGHGDSSFLYQGWNVIQQAAKVVDSIGLVKLNSNTYEQYSPVAISADGGAIDFNTLYDMPKFESAGDLAYFQTSGLLLTPADSTTVYTYDDNNTIPASELGTPITVAIGSIKKYTGSFGLKKGTNVVGTVLQFADTNVTNVVLQQEYFVTKGASEENKLVAMLTANMADLLGAIQAQGTWNQEQLPWKVNQNVPYLFLAELVKKEFDYNTWNGGPSDYALQQLIWNVASGVTPLSDNIKHSWGDTFYQRWDCEKTYPYTEQDTNSIVEVLSFMLESHTNLDGRCDVNRGITNLLNTRPSNTMYNEAYSQKDNFFTYQVLDDKFSRSHFESDIVWSLTKNRLDDIDKWTCLVAVNEFSLDGRYGTVRKILNVNDVLVAFQETGMAQVRFNETAALATTAGLPLQMGNTGKVDGYTMISDTVGCRNKFSINKNSSGVYFADDNGKSFNQFTVNSGIADISTRAEFSSWFKKQLNGELWNAQQRNNFRASYDEVTHDLYLIKSDPTNHNNDVCLIYNTLLNRFTSFMDYIETPMIARLISDGGASGSFALHATMNAAMQSIVQIYQLFAGTDYGYIYGNFCPYSIEYRLNPDPTHDSIFTNYTYTADWTDPTKEVDSENLFDTSTRRYTTFDEVEARNEYQKGNLALPTARMDKWPVKAKFRIWRGDIPRDGDTTSGHTYGSDRMRNPWIHLKFVKNTADNSKMTFHNLTVIYYNQYGRI